MIDGIHGVGSLVELCQLHHGNITHLSLPVSSHRHQSSEIDKVLPILKIVTHLSIAVDMKSWVSHPVRSRLPN
jgi:hypothetical protein